jgi:hypothetical protein
MNKLAVILLILILGTNVFSMPLVFVQSDNDAVEIEFQSNPDANVETEDTSNSESEEYQEEVAILVSLNLNPPESWKLLFSNHTDNTLIGAHPDLVIPPNL